MLPFTHAFDFSGVTADEIWNLYFEADFNAALDAKLGFDERVVLEKHEDDSSLRCSTRITPARNTPSFLRRLGVGKLSYIEHASLDKARDRMDLTITPNIFGDRTIVRPHYTLEDVGGGVLRRTFAGTVEVKLAMVGAKVEKLIVEDVLKSHQTASEFTQLWLTTPAAERANLSAQTQSRAS